MSADQARALVGRVTDDDEFRQRLQDAPVDQRRAILEAEGYGDVRLRHVSAVLPQSSGGELSDDEFASVSGGASTTSDLVSATGVTIVCAAAAVA